MLWPIVAIPLQTGFNQTGFIVQHSGHYTTLALKGIQGCCFQPRERLLLDIVYTLCSHVWGLEISIYNSTPSLVAELPLGVGEFGVGELGAVVEKCSFPALSKKEKSCAGGFGRALFSSLQPTNQVSCGRKPQVLQRMMKRINQERYISHGSFSSFFFFLQSWADFSSSRKVNTIPDTVIWCCTDTLFGLLLHYRI